MNRCEEVLKHGSIPRSALKDDVLMHSDFYLGADYDDGLKHWKYIRKYSNSKGKWTYVYADKETHKDIQKKYNALKSDVNKYRFNAGQYEMTADGDIVPSPENVKARIEILEDMVKYNNAVYNNSLKNVIKQDLADAKRFIAKLFGKKDAKAQRHNLPAGRQKNVTSGGNGVHVRPR